MLNLPDRHEFLEGYHPLPGTYDELIGPNGRLRPEFGRVLGLIGNADEFARTQELAETALINQGVTFSVYSDERGVEKVFPVCLMPRILSAADWERLERGLLQRVQALEHFVDDLYGEQRILRSEAIPAEVVLASTQYVPALRGIRPPAGVRIHVSGIDLIRDGAGTFRVLEDNLRTPSGVSYVLENRLLSKRLIPRAFEAGRVRQVNHYSARLAAALRSVSPIDPDRSTVVVLTPGPYNSAYFEHSFLARQMGVELVQAADLFVDEDKLFLHTTRGPRQVGPRQQYGRGAAVVNVRRRASNPGPVTARGTQRGSVLGVGVARPLSIVSGRRAGSRTVRSLVSTHFRTSDSILHALVSKFGIDPLEIAIWRRDQTYGYLHHSDVGSSHRPSTGHGTPAAVPQSIHLQPSCERLCRSVNLNNALSGWPNCWRHCRWGSISVSANRWSTSSVNAGSVCASASLPASTRRRAAVYYAALLVNVGCHAERTSKRAGSATTLL